MKGAREPRNWRQRMPYHESDYAGDDVFCIWATGDVCVGDEVRFERATFAGSRRRPRFAGFELVTAKVVKESYGEAKQQHTFTLLREDGRKTLIKGRNLYANGVYRKAWADEAARRDTPPALVRGQPGPARPD